MSITLSVLGPLLVVLDGAAVPLRPAQRRVLAILAMTPGGLSRDALIDRMWPSDTPPSARTALQVHVSGIRKQVPGIIVNTATGYRISPSANLEAIQFRTAARDAAGAAAEQDWNTALDRAEVAMALWRSDPLPELAHEPFAVPEISNLQERHLAVAELAMRSLIALGKNHEAIAGLTGLSRQFPLDERIREDLMLALYRAGRQADALREFQSARRTLGEELGIEPGPGLRDLEERILFHDPSLGAADRHLTPHNLPELITSFVGREDEVDAIEASLTASRLVSIVGGPGYGKTRLAIEVAHGLIDRFPGGIWLAELGSARDATSVAATIATATRTTDQLDSTDDLSPLIGPQPILLILDACEHILEPVQKLLKSILSTDGPARILCTTREPIGVAGEEVISLSTLGPNTDAAVQLVIDRVRSVDRSFVPSDADIDGLTELCRNLDGIPLGLELLAKWVPALGIQDTTRLLRSVGADDALDVAIDWSYQLMQSFDQNLLDHMSVFSAPFTLNRAWEVCNESGTNELVVAGGVARLADASLITAERTKDGSIRYRMLDPVREFAAGHLSDPSETAFRHASSLRSTAQAVAVSAQQEDQSEMFAKVDIEVAEYRAAMAVLGERGDWNGVAAIATDLSRYWYARFLAWEGRTWLDTALAHRLGEDTDMRARLAAGFLAWAVHDYESADTHYEACLREARRVGDRRRTADALYGLGLIHQKRRFKNGAQMLQDAAEIYSELPQCGVELGECLLYRGLDEVGRGAVTEGSGLLFASITLLSEAGYLRQVSKASRWLAHGAWLLGNEEDARRHAGNAEQLARETGDQPALSGALIEKAFIELRWGECSGAAAALLGALEPIPDDDLVDICQVLIPTAWLADTAGDPELAGAILGFMDEVHLGAGWKPPEARAAVRLLAERVERCQPLETMSAVTDFLERVASTED